MELTYSGIKVFKITFSY